MTKVLHKKTGNIYYVLKDNVINCTNKASDCLMVLYMNTDGKLFCREEAEFWEKFERCE